MRGKLKQGVHRFSWPWLLAVACGVACGSPRPTETPSTLPPPKAASPKSLAKPTPGTQSLELVTAHVTAADVAIAPDGKWLAFNALGHLYRLSSKGGDAEQLTFGPYDDREPAISPDGRRVAFVSNRGKAGVASVLLLNLSTGEISEIKGALHAAQPSWSPDGKSIGFLSRMPFRAMSARRIDLATDRIDTLASAQTIDAVAFLNDGRLAWSERDSAGTSLIRAQGKAGEATAELNVKGVVFDIVADPKSEAVFLEVRRADTGGPTAPEPSNIVRVSLPGGSPVPVTSVEYAAPNARFSALDSELWLCERGTLWRAHGQTGKKQPLRLSLQAALEVLPRATPRWAVPAAHPAALLDPRVIPKTGGILFTAAGYLWHQPSNAVKATRIFTAPDGFEWGPAAPSPDGSRIAVQVSQGTTQELRIADLKGTTVRTLTASDRSVNFQPAWHPDGTQVAYVAPIDGVPHVQIVDLKTGKRWVTTTEGTWQPTPHFSDDGSWLYYTWAGNVVKLSLKGTGAVVPRPVTSFSTPFDRALVAPDGRSVAFARGDELWWAPASSESSTIPEDGAVLVSARGGRGFSFAPSPSPTAPSLIYPSGYELLQQTVGTDRRAVASLELPPPASEPLLVRNARLIDFEQGRFQDPVSLYIDKGRIQWIGAEAEHKLAPDTRVLDAAGRFAIPGLIDLGAKLAPTEPAPTTPTVGRLEAFLAFGVTTVLDVGGDPALLQAWSDRGQALGAAVPRILSHPSVIKTLAYSPAGEPLLSEAELRERILVAKNNGAHGISAALDLPWELQRVVADEAMKQGLVVSGLAHDRDQMVQGALLGHWSAPGLSAAPPMADDLVQLLGKTQSTVVTSLSTPWGNPVLFREEPARRSDSLLLAFTSASDRAPARGAALTPESRQQAYERTVGGFQLAHHDDVNVALGSGAPSTDCFYGHCLHTELWHLAHAGLTPLQILRQATLGNAEALGAADHFGSLAPGKLADLVLLDKDPLADIHNSLSIAYVISEGRPFKQGAPLAVAAPPPPKPAQAKR